MTPTLRARQVAALYDRYRVDHLNPSNCVHEVLLHELEDRVERSAGLLTMSELGSSLGGKSINLVQWGKGPKRVLLWSQMHGDESTATLALCDIFSLLAEAAEERPWVAEMMRQVTIAAIPMLNPDGAQAVTRHNAMHIDVNRDARALASPESKILRETHRAFRPAFGFNLHDQALSSVGSSKNVTALALLAPAPDGDRNRPLSRVKAMRVCALLVRALRQFADGHLATYDDSYESRAFGDRMQSWGTSTILIESGHWPGDPMKSFVRRLNFIALLVALCSIGDGSYQDVELEYYSGLESNGKQVYDVLIRNVRLVHPSGWEARADIALSLEPEQNRRSASPVATIKEVGDLSTHAGLETIDASARRIAHDVLGIDKQIPLKSLLDHLQLYRSPHRQ
jgi:Zinc carboxypeptidase